VKGVLFAFVLFLGLGHSQDGQANRMAPDANPAEKPAAAFLRRLDAVTWNPVRAELTWLVSVWDLRNGERTLVTKERYTMHPDVAVMESSGEYRRFDASEAKQLRVLMDVISTYAVQSTVWWDYGPNGKVEGQIVPLPDDGEAKEPVPGKDPVQDKDAVKPEKEPEPKAKPAPKAVPSRVLVGPAAEPIELEEALSSLA
jgi:hypothetical protein